MLDTSRPVLLKQLAWIAPAFIIIAIAGYQPFVPIDELLRDPYAVAWNNSAKYKLHYGALSTAGLFVWAAAAAVCLFGSALFRKTGDTNRALVFLACGLFTSYLLADDAFMIHEVVVPHFGGDEKIVKLMIAATAAMIGLKILAFFLFGKLFTVDSGNFLARFQRCSGLDLSRLHQLADSGGGRRQIYRRLVVAGLCSRIDPKTIQSAACNCAGKSQSG